MYYVTKYIGVGRGLEVGGGRGLHMQLLSRFSVVDPSTLGALA